MCQIGRFILKIILFSHMKDLNPVQHGVIPMLSKVLIKLRKLSKRCLWNIDRTSNAIFQIQARQSHFVKSKTQFASCWDSNPLLSWWVLQDTYFVNSTFWMREKLFFDFFENEFDLEDRWQTQRIFDAVLKLFMMRRWRISTLSLSLLSFSSYGFFFSLSLYFHFALLSLSLSPISLFLRL